MTAASTPSALIDAHLGLAAEEVEDGRALEAVARVEVEDALGARALAVEDVRHARDAADVRDRVRSRRGRASASTCVMTCSYGKSREWMSDVWRSVRLHLSTAARAGRHRSTVSLSLDEHAGEAPGGDAEDPERPYAHRDDSCDQKRGLRYPRCGHEATTLVATPLSRGD